MVRNLKAALIAILLLAPAAQSATGQVADLDSGIMAFREQRFDDAERLFKQVVDADPDAPRHTSSLRGSTSRHR